MRLSKEEQETGRCKRCFGRGFKPEPRKSGRGIYLRTCARCGGCGDVKHSPTYNRRGGP
jgi:DnaJ-class molecular chaperone